MKIAAFNRPYKYRESTGGWHSKDWRLFGFSAKIAIYKPYSTTKHQDVYATTIHELAHASHWEFMKNNWRSTDLKVKESWARGVQWELTRMKYTNYKGGSSSIDYTQVAVDMIDSRDSDSKNNGASYPTDKVSDYTIKQLEDALRGKKHGMSGEIILKTNTTMKLRNIWIIFLTIGVIINGCTKDIDYVYVTETIPS